MPTATTPTLNPQGQGIYKKQPSPQGKSAAKSFEAFFVFQMLEHMGKGIKSPEIGGGGFAEDTFRSMLNEKIAQEVSASGRLGIAEAIEDQIARQEAQQAAQQRAQQHTHQNQRKQHIQSYQEVQNR